MGFNLIEIYIAYPIGCAQETNTTKKQIREAMKGMQFSVTFHKHQLEHCLRALCWKFNILL